jgi:integrase
LTRDYGSCSITEIIDNFLRGGSQVGVKVRDWKGAWWVFVDHKRQRKAKRVGVGAAGKRAAEDVAKAYEVQLSLGQFDFSKSSGVAFESYAKEWLDTHGRTLKLGTAEKYAEVLRVHWFPSLGCAKVADITRAQVKAVVVEKARTYARGTISYMIDVLRSCLHSAVEDEIIVTNPATRLGAFATKGRRATPVPTLSRCKTRENPLPSAAWLAGRLHTIQGRGIHGMGPGRTFGSLGIDCRCDQRCRPH